MRSQLRLMPMMLAILGWQIRLITRSMALGRLRDDGEIRRLQAKKGLQLMLMMCAQCQETNFLVGLQTCCLPNVCRKRHSVGFCVEA